MLIGNCKTRDRCALCYSKDLQIVLSLPPTPLANEYVIERENQEFFYLDVALCGTCGHTQLETLVDPVRLFGNYVYVTGTSPVTVEHFKLQVRDVLRIANLKTEPFVIEIGSNDGTALQEWQSLGARVLGVDPADQVAASARSDGVPTVTAFFSDKIAVELKKTHGEADVIIANNVLAHAEDVRDMALGIEKMLAPDGIFVGEVSYLYDMVEAPVFDTIYHEHFSYHTVKPLQTMFASLGLVLFDIQRMPGQKGRGSLRFFVGRPGHWVVRPSVEAAIALETEAGLFTPKFFDGLSDSIRALAKEIHGQLRLAAGAGKKIAGYGAAAKMTTLLYALGLEDIPIEYIVDDSGWKQGLLTPGRNLPIQAPAKLNQDKPDICVIFAWNFAEEIFEKHANFGGKFLVPLPELRMLSK